MFGIFNARTNTMRYVWTDSKEKAASYCGQDEYVTGLYSFS